MADEVEAPEEETVEMTVQQAVELAFDAIESLIQRVEDIERIIIAMLPGVSDGA